MGSSTEGCRNSRPLDSRPMELLLGCPEEQMICNQDLDLISAIKADKRATRSSSSITSRATSRSCLSMRPSTVLSTSGECRARTTKCSPLGLYCPENQFFTVRSFAPVQAATVLTCTPLLTAPRCNAAAISEANLPGWLPNGLPLDAVIWKQVAHLSKRHSVPSFHTMARTNAIKNCPVRLLVKV